jgi:hypothetical protein
MITALAGAVPGVLPASNGPASEEGPAPEPPDELVPASVPAPPDDELPDDEPRPPDEELPDDEPPGDVPPDEALPDEEPPEDADLDGEPLDPEEDDSDADDPDPAPAGAWVLAPSQPVSGEALLQAATTSDIVARYQTRRTCMKHLVVGSSPSLVRRR